MQCVRSSIVFLSLVLCGTACSFIVGKEDPAVPGPDGKQVRLQYVETLRNQASLRGEGFRDVAYSAGTPTTLQRPNSIFADQFRVYVTDQTQPPRVFIFDRGDRTASILAVPAPPAEGKLLNPTGITVDNGNVIYVADPQQGRVFGYDRNGVLLLTFGKPGDLGYPQSLAIDRRANRMYIADTHGHMVKAFSMLGDRLFDYGGVPSDKQLKAPEAVALDREGRLFVVDGRSKHVHIIDPNGKLIKRFPLSRGVPGDSIRPRGIAVDSAGHVYVSDSVNNNILIFGPDGSYVTTWGKTGIVSGDFWTPQGLFIDDRDQIYIADQSNGRVQVYQFLK